MKVRIRVNKNGFGYNRDLKDYTYYSIDTTSQDSAVRFLEEIPLIGYKLAKLKEFAPRKRTFTQEYWPDEVQSVEKVQSLPCRCLSVASGSSFIADGIVVHNTITCSVMFPVWCWTKWYWMRFITASYSSALSLEAADNSRGLIRSTKFQQIYPDLDIKEDKDVKSNYRIARKELHAGRQMRLFPGGGRFTTSVGGTLIGFHGDILIVDDPLNPEQAVSEIELATANRWMEQTLATRKTNKDITPTILIMQRLHQDDPSGHILAKNKQNVRHICIPGEIRNYRKQLSPSELAKFYKGDLMDPNRLSWKTLEDLQADLGQYGYAGQIGQDPTPPGGGMFKVDHFQIITAMPARPDILDTVRYWDKAQSTSTGAPYTAGIKMHRLTNDRWLVEDVKRGRWQTHERERIIRETAEADGVGTTIWEEQEPGSSGKEGAEATIRNLAGFVVYAERPTGDKTFRADPYSVQVNNGAVLLLSGVWNREFIEEHRFFPFSTYKDQVDASSGAFNKLVGKRLVRRIT